MEELERPHRAEKRIQPELIKKAVLVNKASLSVKKTEKPVKLCTCGKHRPDEPCTCRSGCRCGNSHEEHHHESSCCGIEHNHESNCCGIEHNHEGNCCGMEHSGGSEKGLRNKNLITLAIALATLIVSFVLFKVNAYGNVPYWVRIFDTAWVPIVICGLPIYKGAIKNLKRKKITSALLISIAMTASIVMGLLTVFGVIIVEQGGHQENYLFAAGEVAFIMAIGSAIEDITVSKTRKAVGTLISMKPTKVLLKYNGGYSEMNADNVRIGDIVLIKPYETVSVDGEVVSGEGAVDEASITGESTPVDKVVGDKVYQGTKNYASALEVRVTSLNDETTLSKLIEYVKESEKNRAPIVRIADKWAGIIVPASCVISLLVFLITAFATDNEYLEAVRRAITILVVVCPCALALATPIAVSAGIGNAGRKGILIKNGAALEALAKIDAVCFDKTGTLTKGELMVCGVQTETDKDELLLYAASVEKQSEHPIAKAIIQATDKELLEVTDTESLMGIGVKATVNGKQIKAVKPSVCQNLQEKAWYNPDEYADATCVIIQLENNPIGAIYVRDTIRENASDTINALNKRQKTIMLTGDSYGSAKAVGDVLNIGEVYSGLLPEGKVEVIKKLKADGKRVLMLGDGVNDAPALATVDCSVAMGALGSSVAIETADISLMTSDIGKIPFLLKLGRRTINTIRFNIILSLSISFTAIILSSLGLMDVVIAALVHNAGSVLVSLNSARLLALKEKK